MHAFTLTNIYEIIYEKKTKQKEGNAINIYI